METLQQSGMRIELEWTPDHAEVQGNEIADRLAVSDSLHKQLGLSI
jgi:ribonuclease HI